MGELPVQGQTVNIYGFTDHRVSVAATQPCCGVTKATKSHSATKGQGCVPIKLYLQKQAVGRIWPWFADPGPHASWAPFDRLQPDFPPLCSTAGALEVSPVASVSLNTTDNFQGLSLLASLQYEPWSPFFFFNIVVRYTQHIILPF